MIDILFGPNLWHQYAYTLIVKMQYVGHETLMYNGKSRHIRHRHDIVRKLFSSGIITIDYVKSKDNVSDPLTKRPN